MDNKSLTYIFEGKLVGSPLDEIVYLAEKICPAIDSRLIREVHTDLVSLFSGTNPDFQKNTLPYHNLRHSQMVVLAAARLFHGLYCNNLLVSAETLFKGLLAAYFHDTGMLLKNGDPAESGTEYIVGHETRSALFLKNYAAQKGLADDIAEDCAIIIQYTNLESDPATFDYHDHEIQLAGQVIGSADLLAQMGDRYYLECLPLLFHEQEAGRVNQHHSALALMEETTTFYHSVVLKRLSTTFSNTSQAMQDHFRERYKVDRNLYLDNIDKNIIYLRDIIAKCADFRCLEKYLKRTPPPP